MTDLTTPDERLAQIRRDKEAAIDADDYDKAAKLRDEEKQLLAAIAYARRTPDLTDRIAAWLTANGIPPGDVPVDAIPTLADGHIHITTILRVDGKPVTWDGEIITTPTRYALQEPLPADLLAWALGVVDPHGRPRVGAGGGQ